MTYLNELIFGYPRQIQERMFEMSKYNLQVNGQNYEDFVQGALPLLSPLNSPL